MSDEKDIVTQDKDEMTQPATKQIGIKMLPGEHTGQPLYSNCSTVNGGQGVVLADPEAVVAQALAVFGQGDGVADGLVLRAAHAGDGLVEDGKTQVFAHPCIVSAMPGPRCGPAGWPYGLATRDPRSTRGTCTCRPRR